MPTAGLTTKMQKNVKFAIGANEYQKQVNNVEWSGTGGGQQSWQGGTPDAVSNDTLPSQWQCAITCIQAWDDSASFINWLFLHLGEDVAIQFRPYSSGPTFYATITLPTALTIGGKIPSYAEATITCASTKPTTTAPA